MRWKFAYWTLILSIAFLASVGLAAILMDCVRALVRLWYALAP